MSRDLGRIVFWTHRVVGPFAILLGLAVGILNVGLAGYLTVHLIRDPTLLGFVLVAVIGTFGIGLSVIGAWGSRRALHFWRHWWRTRR